MEKDTKLTSLRWIIWTSRSALFHNWIMGLSFGIYLVCIVFALFGIKFPLNAINFPTYIGVSVTGLSFTLALIVAVRNIFTSKELKILIDYQVRSEGSSTVFTDLIAPFLLSAFLWITLAIVSIVFTFWNLKVTQPFLSYVGTLTLALLLVMSFSSLFQLVIDTARDWVNHATLE